MIKVIIEVAVETKNHTNIKSKIKKGGKVLRKKDEHVRRNGVSLADSSGRGNLGRRLASDKKRKGIRTKTGVNPGNPNAREIHLSKGGKNFSPAKHIIEIHFIKGGKNCSPAKRIIDFFNVNLD